jgi:hypothetical protein
VLALRLVATDFAAVIDLIMTAPCCVHCVVRMTNVPATRVEEILTELRSRYVLRADGDCYRCQRHDAGGIYWLRPPDWLSARD